MGGIVSRSVQGDVGDQLRDFLRFQGEMGVTTVPHGEVRQVPKPTTSTAQAPADTLSTFAQEISNCQSCGLCAGRTHVVFGAGAPDADVMFVGEAPGHEEDRQGLPFVGASGSLLTKMIEAIGLTRESVYIANVIKCRPPQNRDPQKDEIAACEPLLKRQIEIVQPQVICTLGRFAAQTLLQTTTGMGRLRGRVYDYEGVKVVPTYHPAALLRNPQWKRPTWEDLKRLRLEYDGVKL